MAQRPPKYVPAGEHFSKCAVFFVDKLCWGIALIALIILSELVAYVSGN